MHKIADAEKSEHGFHRRVEQCVKNFDHKKTDLFYPSCEAWAIDMCKSNHCTENEIKETCEWAHSKIHTCDQKLAYCKDVVKGNDLFWERQISDFRKQN